MRVSELMIRLEKLPEDANVLIPGTALVERVYLNESGSVVLEGYEDGEAEAPVEDE